MKKKILFVGAFKPSGRNMGGQLFACRSLLDSPLSDEIHWITIDSTAKTNLQRNLFSRTSHALWRVVKFILHLLTKRVDSILIFSADRGSFVEKGLMIVFGKIFGKRTILCPRSGLLLHDIKGSSLWKLLARVIFFFCDYVICQTSSWKNFFKQTIGFDESKYIEIPNWINSASYIENYHHQAGRPFHDPLRVLFLGWITKDKGIFELLQAARRLKEHNIQFLIAGDGRHVEQAKLEVSRLGLDEKVDFLGWVHSDAKNGLLRSSDIFVLPSHYEGLPNSILEAMASGIPVIATDVGGIPDIIVHEVTGFLIRQGAVDELTRSILNLKLNPLKRRIIAEAAHRYVHENHNLANAINQFKKIL